MTKKTNTKLNLTIDVPLSASQKSTLTSSQALAVDLTALSKNNDNDEEDVFDKVPVAFSQKQSMKSDGSIQGKDAKRALTETNRSKLLSSSSAKKENVDRSLNSGATTITFPKKMTFAVGESAGSLPTWSTNAINQEDKKQTNKKRQSTFTTTTVLSEEEKLPNIPACIAESITVADKVDTLVPIANFLSADLTTPLDDNDDDQEEEENVGQKLVDSIKKATFDLDVVSGGDEDEKVLDELTEKQAMDVISRDQSIKRSDTRRRIPSTAKSYSQSSQAITSVNEDPLLEIIDTVQHYLTDFKNLVQKTTEELEEAGLHDQDYNLHTLAENGNRASLLSDNESLSQSPTVEGMDWLLKQLILLDETFQERFSVYMGTSRTVEEAMEAIENVQDKKMDSFDWSRNEQYMTFRRSLWDISHEDTSMPPLQGDDTLTFTESTNYLDEDLVVAPSKPSIRCPITQQILVQPVRNPACNHIYSLPALRQVLQQARSGNIHQCPVAGCNKQIILEQCVADTEMQRRLDRQEERIFSIEESIGLAKMSSNPNVPIEGVQNLSLYGKGITKHHE